MKQPPSEELVLGGLDPLRKSDLCQIKKFDRTKLAQLRIMFVHGIPPLCVVDPQVVRNINQIDELKAAKLPQFESIQKYLSVGGSFWRKSDNGWTMTGFMMAK